MYIDPDLVINKENFKLIEYNVVCSICNGIVVSPVQCLECENCFCQSCIEEWKKKQGKDSCPFRCKNPSFRNSRLIKDILSNLKFKCKNGCNQEIPYFELEDHYEEKCPNLKIDYKLKYLEYKNKCMDLLKKNLELENQLNKYRNQNNINNNSFKSAYHKDILYDKTYADNNWICDICNGEYKEKTEKRFRCEICDFDVCIKCKILEESGYKFNNVFLSKNHQHLLNLGNSSGLFGWNCDICGQHKSKKESSYRCKHCNYDICENCKINEENDINLLNSQLNNMQIEQ